MKIIDGNIPSNIHFKWAGSIEPIVYVKPGEELEIIVPDSSTNQITENFSTSDMQRIDESKFDGAVGPIYVEGAGPDSNLLVELVDIRTQDWGWSAILKNYGLLKGEFEERMVIWSIENGFAISRSEFLSGLEIPVTPFLGVIGTAPATGEYGMIAPQSFGGNMDNRLLSKGSRILLPVYANGALLSIADPHASQGDGEVSGTAIESGAKVRLVIKVVEGPRIEMPRAESNEFRYGEVIVAMGMHNDIMEASRLAVRNMIGILKEGGFSAEEAYMLCGIMGDLRISEIVDEPNFLVSCVLPKKFVIERD